MTAQELRWIERAHDILVDRHNARPDEATLQQIAFLEVVILEAWVELEV
jgi:hypothetical protein